MHHFYAYLSKMKYIKRWGLMRNTEEENIKEHSLDVAIVAHGLAMIDNVYFEGNVDAERVMALAMFHEVGEIMTGDIPTPVKYLNPRIKEAYSEAEDFALERIVQMLPYELKEAYTPLIYHDENPLYSYVKAADKICAYIKCVQELKMGNMEFEKAKLRIGEELFAMEEPYIHYFINNFLPSYGLTLDELN